MTYHSIIAQMGETISCLGQLVSDLSEYNDAEKGVPVITIGRAEGSSQLWMDFRDKREVEVAIAQLQKVLKKDEEQLSILMTGKVEYQEPLSD